MTISFLSTLSTRSTLIITRSVLPIHFFKCQIIFKYFDMVIFRHFRPVPTNLLFLRCICEILYFQEPYNLQSDWSRASRPITQELNFFQTKNFRWESKYHILSQLSQVTRNSPSIIFPRTLTDKNF